MNILKRNGNYSRSFPALLNDFFTREMFNWGESNFSNTGTTVQAVNIKENKDNFEVEVAAPGMKKDDFKIHRIITFSLFLRNLILKMKKITKASTPEKNLATSHFRGLSLCLKKWWMLIISRQNILTVY
jgi:hypothetical protein